MSKTTSILLASSDHIVRTGLHEIFATFPGIIIVGETDNQQQVYPLCQQLLPTVLVLYGHSFADSLLAEIRAFRSHSPPIHTLLLTSEPDHTRLWNYIQAGVAGYMTTNESPDTILHAIQIIALGSTWFSTAAIAPLAERQGERPQQQSPHSPLEQLTSRETEVLQMLAQGWTNNCIGRHLGITERTIRFHTRNIFDKLGFKTRSEAIFWAVKQGVI